MTRWKIEPIELGNFIIKYDKRTAHKGIHLWLTVTKTGNVNTEFEVFESYEEAEQALELLIHDFGGYRIDE